MSTLPLYGLPRPEPQRTWAGRRRVIAALGFFAAATLVFSGTLWSWVRPVIHKPLINKYAADYKFDPLWVMAIIKVESGFSSHAQSKRGAVGLMQLLPSTARDIAPEIGLTNLQEADLKDPDINIHLGFQYLARLQRQFPEDEVAVLAAYNAGPGITQQWRKGKPTLDVSDIPFPETQQFVERVQRTYTVLKMLQRWKHMFGMN